MCICQNGVIRITRKKKFLGLGSMVKDISIISSDKLYTEEEVPCMKCRPEEYTAVVEAMKLVEEINEAYL